MDFTGCLNDDSLGPDVRGCRDDFDFTLKFEWIFLSILPSSIFIALAATRIVALLHKSQIVRGAWFKFVKLGAAIVYSALELALVALVAAKSNNPSKLFTASTALSFIAALSIVAVSYFEHSRSPRPSVLLSMYLSLTLLFEITQARTLWLSAHNTDELTFVKFYTATIVFKAVVLGLESQHKSKWLQWDPKEHSPEESSGFWGLTALVWINALLFSGYKKILKIADLFPLDNSMNADKLHSSLVKAMGKGVPGRKHGLAIALSKCMAVPLLLPVPGRVALAAFQFCQPFLIQALLDYLQLPTDLSSPNTGYGLIGATVLIYGGIAVSTTFYWYYMERAMYMARGSLASAVYRKTTECKLSAADDSAALTLMSTDVERIRVGFLMMHECWINPIEVALACYLLQGQLGAAFAAPIVVVALCVAGGIYVARVAGPRQKDWMEKIQKRVGLTANVITNMKHLKISGLAKPVEDSIQDLRVDELKTGTVFRMAQINAAMLGFVPMLFGPVATFAVTSKTLDVTTIFTATSYLVILTTPLSRLFQIVPVLIAGLTCLTRIQYFVEKEPRGDFREFPAASNPEKPADSSASTSEGGIQIIDGSFGWTDEKFNLKDINVKIPAAGLTIVVGPIASGKSTLCKALLGETPLHQGRVILGSNYEKTGYCDQTPFLSNATIRDNIIGFAPYDAQRYNEIIEATMLSRDLSLFPQGDRSMVGSNGITLSGGQKQRVSIARALYLQADLLIFDDILSGLDADTEEAVFNRVFGPTGILKTRKATVVLCTHSVRHLPKAEHIIALGPDGTLVEDGSFEDLLANQKYVHSLGVKAISNDEKSGRSTPSIDSETAIEISRTKTAATTMFEEVDEKSRQMGDVSVYKHYFKSIGPWWVAFFMATGVITGFFFNFPTIWMKYWSEDISLPNPGHSNAYYIGIYALLQVLSMIFFYVMIIITFKVLIMISGASLHKATLRTVIAAPLRFFTTTDSGIVINFFSQDMNLIDSELPMSLFNFTLDIWITIGAAGVIASSSPYIAISYPFMLVVLYAIQMFYLKTSRQLRLLDLEAKSPLYSHFLDTIKGVATFRAFGWVQDGVVKNNGLLDNSQRPAYFLAIIQRWLNFVLNMLIMGLAVIVVVLATQLRSSSGFTGASLVALMTFGDSVTNVIRMYTLLETSMGAVARLKTFSETTAAESQPSETTIPAESWPQKGRIEIKGVSATYGDIHATTQEASSDTEAELALALKNLTVTIEPGQKVAICGRSGSGKSSTILLLLRLLEALPECVDNMTIDGVQLSKVDRETLRRRIIAVPQDAVFLPDGTSFKTNLDPFGVSTDEECQIVLEAVDLWSFVSQRGGLSEGMTPDSLSQGQKQLFSLARALLRRRVRGRVLAAEVGEAYLEEKGHGEREPQQGGLLLLDEVSSSVDIDTDRAMQKIIHKEFEGYTIIMVSHRLEMVMDFDQVLVMDAGTVVEAGVPKELVEVEGTRFRDLWLIANRE